MKKQQNLKYYRSIKEPSIIGIFVYLNKDWDDKFKACYAPIGQHGAIDPAYLDECEEITKEEYIQISEGLYTPAEYL